MEISAAEDKANAIASSLVLTVENAQTGLSDSLHNIPEKQRIDILAEWERTDPLVRNVFVWHEETGLEYPVAGSITREEERFLKRFNALFTSRIPWQMPAMENPREYSEKTKDKTDILDYRKSISNLQNLTQRSSSQDNSDGNWQGDIITKSGWIPWFDENRLYMLGWVQKSPGSHVYGIELEIMTLLSRIISVFPPSDPDGIVYVLLDGNGKILHQAGKALIPAGREPEYLVSLAPALPHWQIGVYMLHGRAGQSGRGFIILSSLLLVIFLAAIILGGYLLTWHAQQNIKDASQKTSFVSSVSHELKTPLTSIRMYAELLKEKRVKDPDKKSHYLQVIVDESRRLTRLVNNVLDFSRLEQGRKKYHLEHLNLVAHIRGIMKDHLVRFKEAGMVYDDRMPDQDIYVEIDRDAIDQVVLNLADNAIKYASEGKEFTLDLKTSNSFCQLMVMDRGPGIPAEHWSKIFNKFHRVDDSLVSSKPGSGLGLSIAQRIMADLGGEIRYEPRDGGGSCFVVEIPLQA